MVDGFDILLAERASREALVAALAFAYDLDKEEIDLQCQGALDACAPERSLFCLVHDGEGGEFPVLMTMSSCEAATEADRITVAAKLTDRLGIRGLISSDDNFDDDSRILIDGFNPPQRVIVREEYNEVLKQTDYFLERYEWAIRKN